MTKLTIVAAVIAVIVAAGIWNLNRSDTLVVDPKRYAHSIVENDPVATDCDINVEDCVRLPAEVSTTVADLETTQEGVYIDRDGEATETYKGRLYISSVWPKNLIADADLIKIDCGEDGEDCMWLADEIYLSLDDPRQDREEFYEQIIFVDDEGC